DSWQGTSPVDRGCCWNGAKETDIDQLSQQMVGSYPSIGGKPVYVALPGVAQSGLGLGAYAPINASSPRGSVSPFKQLADSISFTKGAHSFQAGFEMVFTNSHGFNTGGTQTTRPNVSLGVGTIAVPNITTTNFKGLNALDITTARTLLANLAGTVA